jgi:uncharacterized membrane protein
MKTFMLLVVAALIAGGIYHKEVSRYFSDFNVASSRSGSGTSVVNSVQGAGNSSNALMGGVGNALKR